MFILSLLWGSDDRTKRREDNFARRNIYRKLLISIDHRRVHHFDDCDDSIRLLAANKMHSSDYNFIVCDLIKGCKATCRCVRSFISRAMMKFEDFVVFFCRRNSMWWHLKTSLLLFLSEFVRWSQLATRREIARQTNHILLILFDRKCLHFMNLRWAVTEK